MWKLHICASQSKRTKPNMPQLRCECFSSSCIKSVDEGPIHEISCKNEGAELKNGLGGRNSDWLAAKGNTCQQSVLEGTSGGLELNWLVKVLFCKCSCICLLIPSWDALIVLIMIKKKEPQLWNNITLWKRHCWNWAGSHGRLHDCGLPHNGKHTCQITPISSIVLA